MEYISRDLRKIRSYRRDCATLCRRVTWSARSLKGIFFSFYSSFFFSFFSHAAAFASFFIVLHQTMRIKLKICITLDSVSKIVAGGRHNQMFPILLEQFWEWLRYQGFEWKFEKWRRWTIYMCIYVIIYIYMIWLVRMVLKIEMFFLLLLL